MRRREFIKVIGGAAATWPVAVRAQLTERMRRIGVLMTTSLGDPETQVRTKAFLQGMQELGWTEGRNIRFDVRWDGGTADAARKAAAELVALSPDVILASGVVSLAALQTRRDVPIVFTLAPDPVGAGFVESLAQPGGNVTGFMQFEYSLSGKWLELLKEIAHPPLRVRQCFVIQPYLRESDNLLLFRRWRRQSASTFGRSTYAKGPK